MTKSIHDFYEDYHENEGVGTGTCVQQKAVPLNDKKKAIFVDGRGYVVDGYVPFHIDHIIPVSKGGNNKEGNLQVICRTCNNKKGAKWQEGE